MLLMLCSFSLEGRNYIKVTTYKATVAECGKNYNKTSTGERLPINRQSYTLAVSRDLNRYYKKTVYFIIKDKVHKFKVNNRTSKKMTKTFDIHIGKNDRHTRYKITKTYIINFKQYFVLKSY